jgi:hypothetical protein
MTGAGGVSAGSAVVTTGWVVTTIVYGREAGDDCVHPDAKISTVRRINIPSIKCLIKC